MPSLPKIPALTPKKVLQILRAKGFVEKRQTGSHLVLYHPRLKRRVIVPVHTRDLPIGTLRSILRSAGIDPHRLQQ